MAANRKKRESREKHLEEQRITRAAEMMASFINIVDQRAAQVTHTTKGEVRVNLHGLNFSTSETINAFATVESVKAAVLPRRAMWSAENKVPYLEINGPAKEVDKIKEYLDRTRAKQKMSLNFIPQESVIIKRDPPGYVSYYLDTTPFIRHALLRPEKMQSWLDNEYCGGEDKLVTKPVLPETHLPHEHAGLVKFLKRQIKGINKAEMHMA
jgi:hypothetical protein